MSRGRDKVKIHYYECDLYGASVLFGYTTADEFNRLVGDKFDEVQDSWYGGVVCRKGVYGVFIRRGQSPEEAVLTLHHECIHLAMDIMDDRGVSSGRDNGEGVAYYSEMWFRRFVGVMGLKISHKRVG